MGNLQNIMGRMIFDILEMNIVVSVGITLCACLQETAQKVRSRMDENGLAAAGSTAFDSL